MKIEQASDPMNHDIVFTVSITQDDLRRVGDSMTPYEQLAFFATQKTPVELFKSLALIAERLDAAKANLT